MPWWWRTGALWSEMGKLGWKEPAENLAGDFIKRLQALDVCRRLGSIMAFIPGVASQWGCWGVGAASGCTTWRYRGAHSRLKLLLFVQPCGRASVPFHFPFMYAHLPNAAFFCKPLAKWNQSESPAGKIWPITILILMWWAMSAGS